MLSWMFHPTSELPHSSQQGAGGSDISTSSQLVLDIGEIYSEAK